PGDDEPHEVFPAAMKLAMRFHMRKLCENPHCVDSLVLYMNSPTKNDGTSLLWDIDQDGKSEESERYRIEELLSDLRSCAARQVHVIVDQSYAGELARAFRRSREHRNVVVYASGKDGEYSYGNEYTQHWVDYPHTHRCTHHVHEEARIHVLHSTPEIAEPDGTSRTTIFGAPCDVIPPFTEKELRRNYWGCQNLPTAIWFRQVSSRSSDIGLILDVPRYKSDSSMPYT
ncbi:uncharacterized protein LOC106178982, partial [Lingula anatina]|uniref:Uncharacterized protein LOC106178982 n=1 Tax=Lingula anatina TaxID=7574 RepID=A0A1S3K6J4_LINAN